MKPRLKELAVLGRDGFRRLAYAEWGSPTANRTVICVHGVSRTGRDFDTLAEALVKRGARVVAPDLPGRGRSEWLTSASHYTDRAYTHAISALIARLDVDGVDWVGTSLGGHIGMLMAAEPGTPVRRLVLNDFGARIAASALRRIGSYLDKPFRFGSLVELEAHLRDVHAPFGELSDAYWRHLAQHSSRPDAAGGFRLHFDPGIALRFSMPMLMDVVLWQLWEKIECPVLIARGAESDLLSARTVREMQQRGPTARAGRVSSVEFADCGHAPALVDESQIDAITTYLFPDHAAPRGRPSRQPAVSAV